MTPVHLTQERFDRITSRPDPADCLDHDRADYDQRCSIGNPIHDALVARDVPSKSYYQEGELDSLSAQERMALFTWFQRAMCGAAVNSRSAGNYLPLPLHKMTAEMNLASSSMCRLTASYTRSPVVRPSRAARSGKPCLFFGGQLHLHVAKPTKAICRRIFTPALPDCRAAAEGFLLRRLHAGFGENRTC
jgi:hypothetical protein